MNSILNIIIFIIILNFFTIFITKSEKVGTVFYDESSPKNPWIFKASDFDKKGLARGVYSNKNNEGWGLLHIETNPLSLKQGGKFKTSWSKVDRLQTYAAGYLEGILTVDDIYSHFVNLKHYTWFNYPNNEMPKEIIQFFVTQQKWIEQQIEINKGDYYWEHVGSMWSQYNGLVDGYNFATQDKSKKIDKIRFLVMTAFGDLFDIKSKTKQLRFGDVLNDSNFKNNEQLRTKKFDFDFKKLTDKQIEQYIMRNDHCSGFIKITKNYEDILFGHTSWFVYSSMNKIYKEYEIRFLNPKTKSNYTSFSSYPANLSSNDDFYITQARLYVMETTNNVFKKELFEKVTPKAISTWMRAMISNRMADNGKDWTRIFSLYNSGSYNNQYTILDLKKFDPENLKKNNNILRNGLVTIVEQIPGKLDINDVTPIIQTQTYFPSYNVPWSTEIRNISGYFDVLKERPQMKDIIDYFDCFRAKIFRRDHDKVQNINQMKEIITYNDYLNDPISKKDPAFGIMSRYDLRKEKEPGEGKMCFGGLDAKVSSFRMIHNFPKPRVFIKVGPTVSHKLPPFKFDGRCSASSSSHKGFSEKPFNYKWKVFVPMFFN